jgi:hypothetical protein
MFERHSISDLVVRAKDIAMEDFTGTLPIAKLNCYAVLQLCFDMLKDIATHACASGYSAFPQPYKDFFGINLADRFDLEDKSVENWLRFVDEMMLHVDTIMTCHKKVPVYGKLVNNLNEYPPLLLMRDAIVKACDGKEVSDFLWKEIWEVGIGGDQVLNVLYR